MRDFDTYFNDGKQIKPLPKKWMNASLFKVGDRIQYLDFQRWSFKKNGGNLKGLIATVIAVHQGYGLFPSEWRTIDEDGFGCWFGQHAARLTVDFGPEVVFGERTENGKRVDETRRSMCLSEEGRTWRKLSVQQHRPQAAKVLHLGDRLGACGELLADDNKTGLLTKTTCEKCKQAMGVVSVFLGKATRKKAKP